MKKEIYHVLWENREAKNLVLLSVVDGTNKGEKMLLAADTILATDGIESVQDSFLYKNRNNILPVEASQLKQLEENQIYCEKIGSQPKFILCGGGHVSTAILRIGKMMGFFVTVIDDRLSFVNEAMIMGADKSVCDDFVHALSEIEGTQDTYFIIVTRGHRWDADCLREILKKEYAYVGMMGSKRRIIMIKNQLEEEGYEKAELAKLHAPIGVSISAESPEEIAISIWAEIIQEKNRRKKVTGYDAKSLRILSGEDENETSFVLATIVSRRGSVPREIGTKMIIFPDEKIIGTIGGGCMESEVIRTARYLLRDKTEEAKLVFVDMSGADAEEEGMVCGGSILVNLEVFSN